MNDSRRIIRFWPGRFSTDRVSDLQLPMATAQCFSRRAAVNLKSCSAGMRAGPLGGGKQQPAKQQQTSNSGGDPASAPCKVPLGLAPS